MANHREDSQTSKNLFKRLRNSNRFGRPTVDAAHPFFKAYTGQMRDAQTSTEDDLAYHCKECELYFPVNMKSVKEHFHNRAHLPVDCCVYCNGPVCEYYYNSSRLIFHSCESSSKIVNSSTIVDVIKRKLSWRNSNCDVV
ncbi:uncharacterized protein [Rhodnius prolixus]|uniref:uncharacterized protein n=1 Tax=Rhodnius prolixus TaxID=13249 RepID=UPI003D1877F9